MKKKNLETARLRRTQNAYPSCSTTRKRSMPLYPSRVTCLSAQCGPSAAPNGERGPTQSATRKTKILQPSHTSLLMRHPIPIRCEKKKKKKGERKEQKPRYAGVSPNRVTPNAAPSHWMPLPYCMLSPSAQAALRMANVAVPSPVVYSDRV